MQMIESRGGYPAVIHPLQQVDPVEAVAAVNHKGRQSFIDPS
jgi:hypothetical protein